MQTARVGLGSALRSAQRMPANQLAMRRVMFKRTVKTESLTPNDGLNILNSQRLRRPSSPHFTIYQPQLTWLGSIANRVTGVGLSVLLYGFALAYLVAPETFSSKKVVEQTKKLPTSVKIATKTILAAPFAFHSWNGLRHLAWDLNKFMTVKGAYQSGYAVLGATAISTVALVLM